MEEIQEIYKIIEYLDDKGKDEWSALLHGFIIYIDENLEQVDLSEEEGDAIDEGVPEVHVDSNGFHSLV
tara:strand:- start:167 stop:373 length:207 start_codon:yes stop_codon:yes gene_type:complete